MADLVPLELVGAPKSILSKSLVVLESTTALSAETEGLRMGGGTILAMHWQHRLSIDVDLAMPKKELRLAIQTYRDQLRETLTALREVGQISRVRFTHDVISWNWRGLGEFSVSSSGLDDRGVAIHRDRDSAIVLSPISDILYGKFVGRVLGTSRLLVRDGYDLCYAHKTDPLTFKSLIQSQRSDDSLALMLKHITSTQQLLKVGHFWTL